MVFILYNMIKFSAGQFVYITNVFTKRTAFIGEIMLARNYPMGQNYLKAWRSNLIKQRREWEKDEEKETGW